MNLTLLDVTNTLENRPFLTSANFKNKYTEQIKVSCFIFMYYFVSNNFPHISVVSNASLNGVYCLQALWYITDQAIL